MNPRTSLPQACGASARGAAPPVYRVTANMTQAKAAPIQRAVVQPKPAVFAPRSSGAIQPLIVFIGDGNKSSRIYKTQIINKVYGGAHETKALLMLKKGELKTIYDKKYSGIGGFFSGLLGKTKDVLIVNAHGSRHTFEGMTAKTLFDLLLDKGLTSTEYSRVVLVACKVNNEDTYDNFAKQFQRLITETDATSGIDVVAPIGNVSYDLPEVDVPGTLGKKLDLSSAKMYVRADYGGGEERREVTGSQSAGFRLARSY